MKVYSPTGNKIFIELETRREEQEILIRQKYREHARELMKRYPQVSEVISKPKVPLKHNFETEEEMKKVI